MQKTTLGLMLMPVTLAFAMAAAPVLAQSSSGTGTSANPLGTTGTPGSPSGTVVPEMNRGAQRDTTAAPVATAPMAGAMGLAANSVLMHRPRLSQLIGTNVYNENNETIGEVDDILLTGTAATGGTMAGRTGTTGSGTSTGTGTGTGAPSTAMPGTVAGTMSQPMAVIQVGGFLGIGARLVTVPLSELQWNVDRDRVILPHATKEMLQSRPAFSYDTLRRG